MSETLSLVVKFVSENAQSNGYTSNIISNLAQTGDLNWFFVISLVFLCLGMVAFIVHKKFSTASAVVGNHIDKGNNSINYYKTNKFIVGILILSLVACLSSLIFSGTFKALAENSQLDCSKVIEAVVHDDGSVTFNDGYLNASQDKFEIKVDNVKADLCSGYDSSLLTNVKWDIKANSSTLYNGVIPGENKNSIELDANNVLKFSASGLSAEVANQLVDKEVFTLTLSAKEIPIGTLKDVKFNPNNGEETWVQKVVYGEKVQKPIPDPIKRGYDFREWQLNGKTFDFENTSITEDIELVADWQIQQTIDKVPTWKGSESEFHEQFKYDGDEKNISDPIYWNNYDESALTLDGDLVKTDAGDYIASFTPKFGYAWEDGTKTAKEVNWQIYRRILSFNSESDSKTYDGKSFKHEVALIEGDGFAAGEDVYFNSFAEVKDAGTYSNSFVYTLKEGTKPENYSISTSYGNLIIEKAVLKVTTYSAEKTYDGEILTADGSIEGMVEGESASLNITGSQKSVGSSDNTYELIFGSSVNPQNYQIIEEIGKLTVNEYSGQINVVVTGGTWTYDGQEHGATIDIEGMPEKGYTVKTCTPSASEIDANEDNPKVAKCEQLVINNAEDEDVTTKLNINYGESIVKIEKAGLSVITESATKIYDAEPLTADGTIKGFVAEESATLELTGMQTEIGSSNNTYTILWDGSAKEQNYKIVSEQIGTLTVTAPTEDVIVTTTGGTWTYDGKEHGATVELSNLPEGCTYVASSDVKVKDYTSESVTATCNYLAVYSKQGTEITDSLTYKYVNGTIQINKATINVVTNSATKVYDGEALTSEGSYSGVVDGDSVNFKTTGSQVAVGSSQNTYELSFNEGTNTENYTVQANIGTLTVDEYAGKIIVTTTGTETTYDGQEHGATVSVSPNPLPVGYNLEKAQCSQKVKDVNEEAPLDVTCDVLIIKNAQGNDVTNSLNIDKIDGKIVVHKKQIDIVTESKSKPFDGSPLVAGGTMTGLVDGENAELVITGSQTNIGSSLNTYTINWGETKSTNYLEKASLGTLTVTQSSDHVVVTTIGGEFTYDGYEHTADVSVTNLPSGCKVESASSDAKATDYTETAVAATCDHLKIVNAQGVDITDQLSIEKVDGNIKINKRDLNINSSSLSQVYNGQALQGTGTVSGFASPGGATEFANVTFSSIINVTPVPVVNQYNITWSQESGAAKECNYNIVANLGTLTIDPRTIDIKGDSGTFTYNGTEHTVTGTSCGEGQLINGHTYNCSYSAKGTDVGVYEGIIDDPSSVTITDYDGNDVSANYEITTIPGKLIILSTDSFEIHLENCTTTYDGTEKYNTNTPTSDAVAGTNVFSFSFEEEGEYVDSLDKLTKVDANLDGYTIYVKCINEFYAKEATTTSKLIINRASRNVTLSKYNFDLIAQSDTGESIDYKTDNFDVNCDKQTDNDKISVVTEDVDIASFEITNNNVKVNAEKGGNKTFTVVYSQEGDVKNYDDVAVDITVNVDLFTYAKINDNQVKVTKYIGIQNLDNATLKQSITVPDSDQNITYDVIQVGDGTNCIFKDTYVQNIILNNKVTQIASKAFMGSELETIINTSSLSNIGDSAFEECNNLTQFGSTINAVTTNLNLKTLGSKAFKSCSNISTVDLSLSASIIEIKDSTFQNCTNVQSIKLHNNITSVLSSAFESVGKRDNNGLTLDDSSTMILWDQNKNDKNGIDRLEISSSKYLNVRLIAANAFDGSNKLKKVVIDKTTKVVINSQAFANCSKLETYFVKDTPIEYGTGVLNNCGTALENEKKLVLGGNKVDHENTNLPALRSSDKYLVYQQEKFNPAESKKLEKDDIYYWCQTGWKWSNVVECIISASCVLDTCGTSIEGGKNANAGSIFRTTEDFNGIFTLLDTGANASTAEGGKITKGQAGGSSSNQDGGGLWAGSGTIKIYDCNFTENKSENGSIDDGNGGAIAIGGKSKDRNATVYIYNGYFEKNYSYEKGGTFIVAKGATLNMYGGTIVNSASEEKGGAIFVLGTANLNNVTISNCKSGYNDTGGIGQSAAGGALYVNDNASTTLENCTIEYNTAGYSNSGDGQGGGIYLSDNSTLTMFGGSISYNVSNQTGSWGGGGVMMAQGSKFTLNGGEISYNTTGAHGGGVYVRGGSNFATFTINKGSKMIGNKYNSKELADYYLQKVPLSSTGKIVFGSGVNPGDFIEEK